MVIIIFILLQYPIDHRFAYASDILLLNDPNLQGLKQKNLPKRKASFYL